MVLLFWLACAPPPLADTGDSSPGIVIDWPEPNAEVVACTMVLVHLKNLTLREPDPGGVEPPDTPGEGHWHAYYGETYVGSYRPYLLADMSTFTPGEYQITVELEQNQHEPLLDEEGLLIQDTVVVDVTAGACDASLEGLE